MSKKSKRSKLLQKKLTTPAQLDQKIGHAQHQILQGDFAGTINTCTPLLSKLPRRSSLRVEVLALLGLAHGMSQNFEKSYELFTEAVTIDPTNAELWYNRGLACRFTSRVGQAVRDFEQAVKLSGNDSSELTRKFVRELDVGRKELKQSLTLYNKGDNSSSPTAHTTIEKIGNTIKGTRRVLGKQPPRYRFFLNPYEDVRFTTCPQCRIKTRMRKFPLVIHVNPMYTLILGKTCRYCNNCDLLIVHQDQLEEQLAAYFSTANPKIIGNDYLVMGTVDKPEWRQGMQNPLSTQEMIEHLHDFKEAITFKYEYN